jgi:hypothetical protein
LDLTTDQTVALVAEGMHGFANVVERSILSRVAHEGLAFDKLNNLHFVDECTGGGMCRYTPITPNDSSPFVTAGAAPCSRSAATRCQTASRRAEAPSIDSVLSMRTKATKRRNATMTKAAKRP